jgi:ribosomal protein L25 (general stress protein Ctc)
MASPPVIAAAVEGIVDEAVARRLIREAGGIPGPVYGKNGKQHLR